MPKIILVMLGGGLGAGARFLVGQIAVGGLAENSAARPYATLTVNLAGGLLMGLLAGAAARGVVGEAAWAFAGVGVLGGFTTFSAFSAEAVGLIARGDAGGAILYIAASVGGSLLLFAIGLLAMQRLLGGAAA